MSQETTNDNSSALPRMNESAIKTEQGGLTPAQREFAAVIGHALANLWLKEIASKSDSSRKVESETGQ